MFRYSKILVMVVITVLLAAGGLFAVAALSSHDQALADVAASAIASPSPDSGVTQSPTPTVDSAAVLLDIKKFKKLALKVEKKARLARVELVKRRKAFGKSLPAKLKPHSAFDTWESRRRYYKCHLDSIKRWNSYYWNKMVTKPGKGGTIGVDRWKPLLRYCGMPAKQMWHALSVMWRESNGDSKQANSSNHVGLYQFARDWWWNMKTGKLKWNPRDPFQNVLHFVRAVLGKSGWSPWAETA